MKNYRSLIFSLCLAILVQLVSCEQGKKGQTLPRNVFLTRPVSLSGSKSVTYSGIVEEGASVKAAFMADGKISSILVKEGDRVKKGQLIAMLDDSDYKIGVSQLEAQYDQMTKEKERMDAMFAKHNIAPNDYEKFSTGYEQLKLQLEMARRQLDYTRLYSPSDGYVASNNMNVGELTGAGTPVFSIVNDTRMVASLDVPVSLYLNRAEIVSAEGNVPGIDSKIPLEMMSFTPDIDNNMLYHLKLSVPGKMARELFPGMNISVEIVTSDNDIKGSMIPSRSLFEKEGHTFVWLYNPQDSTIHKKEVKIEGAPVGKMSVVAGLDNEDPVVETGVKQLYEGEKVNVLNPKDLGL